MKVNGSIPIGDNFLSAFHIVVNLYYPQILTKVEFGTELDNIL